MSVLSVQAVDAFDTVTDGWDELADRLHASPFLRAGWVEAWWRAFGSGRLLLLAAHRSDGRVTGVLPLRCRHGVAAGTTNWHTPEFGILAEDDESAAQLLDAAFARRPRQLALRFVGCTTADHVRAAASRHRYVLLSRLLRPAPYIPIVGDLDAYERGLDAHLRRELRRRRRRLAEAGPVRTEVISDAPDIEARLAVGFQVEASGWKGRRGTAIDSSPDTRRFYVEVARWAAERRWLRLAFLHVGERPVAFDLSLEHAGVHYLVKTGYDPAFHAYAPGKILRRDMIARAFACDLESYEFLGLDEPWKMEWTNLTRQRWLVQAFRPSTAGLVDRAAHAYARPVAKAVLARIQRR